MDNIMGRQRVYITHVMPTIDNGTYPSKAVINDETSFTADLFADGHDQVSASLFIKAQHANEWQEVAMQHVINDHWAATFRFPAIGVYFFCIRAWVNHYASWINGLQKKVEAEQDVYVDLLIGANLLEEATTELPLLLPELQKWGAVLRQGAIEKDLLKTLKEETLPIMRQYRLEPFTSITQVYKIEAERQKAGFSTWYELFPRSTAEIPGQHGSFQDVKRLLPRIAKMGFDVLYLPPIHPIGEVKRKGKNNALIANPEEPGSPWAIGNRHGGHKAIHPQLGSLEDFQELIISAKKYDIEIAMDIAFQCAPDHPYVQLHPNWFKWRPDGSIQYAENPPKRYEDILPFDFETSDWQNLWSELKSVLSYWIAIGISIFRIDNPHTKALAFWEWVIPEIRKDHPATIFLAEAFTRPRIMEQLAKGGFNQSYTYFTWRNTKWELETYLYELTKTDMRYYFRPCFWPNTPDILPPMLSEGGENAHIMRAILAATLSANYGIYGPVYEFGLNEAHPGKEEYTNNEKYEIKHWDWNAHTRIGEIIARLNRIRKLHPALQNTYNIEFAEVQNDQLICYVKTDQRKQDRLIIAVNLDLFNSQGAFVKIPLSALHLDADKPYHLFDLLSGDKYEWFGEWNYIELNPYLMPAHIFYVTQ
ncbi:MULTISPECIES: alpha-1,4-glucan--maltose-1-phosphate maltosyltransferase [Olivibacter]|uniref:Alpha-1,4-glucan:maltose-1-phosphate maltosyltransferase n=1 Tax=Olivibacter jilunii TaxID=985016 RepID=A0ABW6B4N8_9SPHI|nr:alpha-1,4-glucan--maltose-1-phosphate maltosyltransferase [Pseudosphingobacterium sp.]